MPLLVSTLQGVADVRETLLSQCNSCAKRFVLSTEPSPFVSHFTLLFTLRLTLHPRVDTQKFYWINALVTSCFANILVASLHWDNFLHLKIRCRCLNSN